MKFFVSLFLNSFDELAVHIFIRPPFEPLVNYDLRMYTENVRISSFYHAFHASLGI